MHRSLTMKQLEVLSEIAYCQSISEVARKFHTSPSSISKKLALLEEIVGTSLFHRTTRTLKLTESGEYFVEKSRKLLLDFEQAMQEAAGYQQKLQGELKITCSLAFGDAQLISLVQKYREIAPDVEINIDLNDDFVNLNGSNIDIALRIAQNPPQNYATKKFTDIHWVYCASKQYLEKRKVPETKLDLLEHHHLIYPKITPSFILNNHHKGLIKSPIIANSSLALLKGVLAHQGIAYLPTYLVGEHLLNGQIIPIKIDNCLTYKTHTLYALYFPCKYPNPKIRSFIDFLSTLITDPYWDKWDKSI